MFTDQLEMDQHVCPDGRIYDNLRNLSNRLTKSVEKNPHPAYHILPGVSEKVLFLIIKDHLEKIK